MADCEQIRGRMLELLYGELPPDARAEVSGHVAGCESCRAELAALESTRSLARGAMTADSPPPRTREAILRAAAAAVRPRPVAAAEKPPFWAWLRQKWTLPTFATIGAVAVFLLASRIFLEPEKTYERGKEGLVPVEAPAPATPPAQTVAPSEDKKASEEKRAREEAVGNAQPAAPKPARHKREAKAGAPAASAPAGAFAPPPPPAALDDGLEMLRKEAPAEQSEDDREERPRMKKSASRPAAAPAPAPEGAARAPAAASAPAPRAAAKSEAPLDLLMEPSAGSGAAVDRESPAAKADRLFAQRRWADAAVVYRQLLRDDPRSPNAARWRQRLATCEANAR
jgi:hypothetical protein